MARREVSASDVAKAAGVSRTTVSFVLNNTPGKNISEGTRQRVLSAAEQLGYTPNEAARSLALSKRRVVGLLICHTQHVYTDAFIMRVIEGMSLAVNRARIRLVVQPITLKDADYLQIAERLELDGMVLINAHDNDPGLEGLVNARFPAVAMDYLPEVDISQVYVNGHDAAERAVNYLIELGHRDIAMITHARPVYAAARQRTEGYRRALDAHGIEFNPELLRIGDFSEESGYRGMAELLDSAKPPTAVFAGNDVIAYGAIDAANDRGISIPDQLSLVGYDDDYLSRYMNPPLTTVVMPAAGMGSTAVNTLVDLLDGESSETVRHELPTQLAYRDSCTAISSLDSSAD